MSDGIFVLHGEELVEMTEQPYDTEDVFQALLAKYPNLLAGGQMNRADPRRWILVSREVSVPGEQDGAGRWSLDHLFLDQDAIPTLIEVKRSSDTRIRREVVGQMLDYAANAVAYWPVEKMRAEYEATCGARSLDPDQEIQALVESKMDSEQFWQAVKTNLQAGKVRMLFVADKIPTELQRIIEFLNQQMDPAEVLGVEIKQYVGSGMKTLVPRVIGQTMEAEDRKAVARGPSKQWDEPSFFETLTSKKGAESANIARNIFAWATERGLRIRWGKGAKHGSFFAVLDHRGDEVLLMAVWTYGLVEMQLQYLTNPPFDEEAKRFELLNRLNSIPGVRISPDALSKRPSVDLQILQSPSAMKQFLDCFDWVIEQIKLQ